MTFEQRVRTYLQHKAATITIPPRSLQSLLKGALLDDALGDLRSMNSRNHRQDPSRQRRRWFR